MTKFRAQTIRDFMTDEANAGRIARGTKIAVCVETADGSWCELDADDSNHAKILAMNWVEFHNARGASCWIVLSNGHLASHLFYLVVSVWDEQSGEYVPQVRNDIPVSGI